MLFAKTLVRKDVASSAAPKSDSDETDAPKIPVPIPSQQINVPTTAVPETRISEEQLAKEGQDDGDFSSKAQIMTLMTTDVDRVSEFAWHMFALVGRLPVSLSVSRFLIFVSKTPRSRLSLALFSCTS